MAIGKARRLFRWHLNKTRGGVMGPMPIDDLERATMFGISLLKWIKDEATDPVDILWVHHATSAWTNYLKGVREKQHERARALEHRAGGGAVRRADRAERSPLHEETSEA